MPLASCLGKFERREPNSLDKNIVKGNLGVVIELSKLFFKLLELLDLDLNGKVIVRHVESAFCESISDNFSDVSIWNVYKSIRLKCKNHSETLTSPFYLLILFLFGNNSTVLGGSCFVEDCSLFGACLALK
jgi:hypothetical protein